MPAHHLVLDPTEQIAVPVVSDMGIHGYEGRALMAVQGFPRDIDKTVIIEWIEVVAQSRQKDIDALGGRDFTLPPPLTQI